MKRKRTSKKSPTPPAAADAAAGGRTIFTSVSIDHLHPDLAKYLHSPLAQSATFDPTTKAYKYMFAGQQVTCGGLLSTLKYAYYPRYDNTTKKRRHKGAKLIGSTAKQGKQIDAEIGLIIERRLHKKNKKPHPMTQAILNTLKDMGQTLQASQVPVPLANNSLKMTQADLITKDAFGKLWLIEIKCGSRIGFNRKQKQQTHFEGKLREVECNGLNIWHLQLAHTRMALEAQGVPISEARVIQVYKHKEKGLVVKVHEQPKWVKNL